ncbi:hypothetical protein CW362_17210 [Streptomyces populi]|uniref:Proline rich protein membrane protein n=1 Tax=Streptomyces populi TaxID=2058924 RepID=A0A2I0SPF5_9ACTN|nr:hypothetical protein [Streptomyces populi]PKT71821.1 hypothetical protein CW362_17210 [Streptomyces populi]
MRTRIRGRRRRHNPLRRRSDVVEAWWALAVGVLMLVGAPLAGAGAAWWAYDGAQAHAAARRAAQHHVRAVLVEDAPATVPSRPGGGRRSLSAPVRWTGTDGTARTGLVRVPAGLRRGTRIDVWTDARGTIVRPAPSSSMILQQALALGVFTAAGAAFAVSVAHLCVRRALMRRRLAQWERDWARTEPDWTRRTA